MMSKMIEEIISSIPDHRIKVDVLESIRICEKVKLLPKERCDTLTGICIDLESNKERLAEFACCVYETVSLQFLCQYLDRIGLSDYANAIYPTSNRPIHRRKLLHSKVLQLVYCIHKEIIDCNVPFDKGEFLRKRYDSISNKFKKKDNLELLKEAGKFAVVTWLRVQHCKRDTKLIRKVLNEMLERWPGRPDDTLADIFYNSKMAIVAIMEGDVDSAKKYNGNAKKLSALWQDPLINVLICHDTRYTNQRIFEHKGSEEHRRAIYDETIKGLNILQSDNDGCEQFNRQLKRMFLLYVAQHKLNIHNDLNCRETDLASADDVKLASDAIKCFEGTLDKEIDPRRNMIIKVCKARVCESQGNLTVARKLLDDATEQAEEGAHYQNEARNIREFTNRLLLRD